MRFKAIKKNKTSIRSFKIRKSGKLIRFAKTNGDAVRTKEPRLLAGREFWGVFKTEF
jgi:predicted RNA-binding protein YlxR (DUF448 family)